MKTLLSLLTIAGALGMSTSASAGDLDRWFLRSRRPAEKPLPPTLGKFVSLQQPVPPAPVPMGEGGPALAVPAEPIVLYPRVRYEDLDNIHPCAVKRIVQVLDPCPPPAPCGCCKPAPRCVYVMICVPPCDCPRVKVSRHGTKVEYDYGDYEVEITSSRGRIEVNYDD